MNIKTACNHLATFKTRLSDCWSAAECYGSNQDEQMAMVARAIYDTPEWSRCPRWLKSEIRALNTEYLHRAMRERMAFRYRMPDGRFVEYSEELPEDDKQAIYNKTATGCHVWLKRESYQRETPDAEGFIVRRYRVTNKAF